VTRVKRCAREGCDRPVATNKGGKHRYCTFVCRGVDFELLDAHRLCSAIGDSPAAGELWSAAVALSDALSEYQRLDRGLFSVAQSVGFTADQWYAVKRPDRVRVCVGPEGWKEIG
jgi:hypothetical protein